MLGSMMGARQRSEEAPIVLGVCTRIAHRARLDVRWVRVAFIVLGLASGVGVVAYLIAALVWPIPGEAGLPLGARVRARFAYMAASAIDLFARVPELAERWRARRSDNSARGRLLATVGLVTLAVGAYLLLDSFDLLDWITGWRAVALVMIALGAAALTSRDG